MAPTAHYVAMDRPDMQYTTSVLTRTLETLVKLLSWSGRRLGTVHHEHGGRSKVVWCSRASTCWTVTVSNSTRYRSAALWPSCARSCTAWLEDSSFETCFRPWSWRQLREVAWAQDLTSEVRRQSSRRVDEVRGPRSTSQTDQAAPLSVPGTRCGLANSVALAVVFAVTSQSYSRQLDWNGWEDRGDVSGGRMASQRIENTSCWVRRDDNMDTVVGTVDANGWRRLLVVTSKQNVARRTVATQTEPCGLRNSLYVTQFGECYHRHRKCHHGLRNASRVNESRMCQFCGGPEALNHSAENRRNASRRQPGNAASCRQSGVLFHRSVSTRIRMGAWEQHRDDVKSEQLWKLQATFRAGFTVRTCVAGTRRNTHWRRPVERVKARSRKVSLHAQVRLKLRRRQNESTRALAESSAWGGVLVFCTLLPQWFIMLTHRHILTAALCSRLAKKSHHRLVRSHLEKFFKFFENPLHPEKQTTFIYKYNFQVLSH